MSMTFHVAAFYKFVAIADPVELRQELRTFCSANGTVGTILVAPEGINGTVAGSADQIANLLAHLRTDARFADLTAKHSEAPSQPFPRMRVRLKREIVTFGVPEANPTVRSGTPVDPHAWDALIADPDVLLIDARNSYEIVMGTFPGAIDPLTRYFGQLPARLDELVDQKRPTKVAMFCTGGIRCEKASAYVLGLGVDHVYQLKGGILKYLEDVPPNQSQWQGECYVFDHRVAVTHGVTPGTFKMCYGCGNASPGDAITCGTCGLAFSQAPSSD
jgi:UPF0176 protein